MWFCGLGEPGPVNCSLQMCLSCIFLFIWNWSATHFSNWPVSTIFMALVIRGTLFTSSPQPSLLQAEWSWPSTSNLADSTIVWVSLFSLLLQNHHASLGDHNYTLHWTCLRIAPREDVLFFFFFFFGCHLEHNLLRSWWSCLPLVWHLVTLGKLSTWMCSSSTRVLLVLTQRQALVSRALFHPQKRPLSPTYLLLPAL